MALRNTTHAYGSVAKWLHWLTAAGIILMLILGTIIGLANDDTAFMTPLIKIHKSLGLTVLVLLFIRLLWRFTNPKPMFPRTMSAIERIAAETTHLLLYLIAIAIILVGLFMSAFGGHTTYFWWILNVTPPVPISPYWSSLLGDFHVIFAWVLAVLIVLHIAAAVGHQWIKKDNILRRMLPQSRH